MAFVNPKIEFQFLNNQPPYSLRDISVQHIGKLIIDFCLEYSRKKNNGDNWLQPAQDFKDHIMCHAKPMWSEVTNFDNMLRNIPKEQKCDIDAQVLLTLVIHDDIKVFLLDKKTMQLLGKKCSSIRNAIRQHLPSFCRLRRLDISGVGYTDYDLEFIGQNCAVLESIVFNTRYSELCKCVVRFTADGLLQLANCTILRSIEDSNKLEGFKPEVIAHLLQTLKNLVHIEYEYMEYALMELMSDHVPLQLQILQVHITNPENIKTIAKLCPNIKSLHMNQNAEDLPGIFPALINTHWTPNVLSFKYLFFNEEMKSYLRLKGNPIEVLNIDSISAMDPTDVRFIGENCPYITKLKIKCVTDNISMPELNSLSVQQLPASSTVRDVSLNAEVFKELTHLELSGHVIDNGSLLKLFLKSDNLAYIRLENIEKELKSLTYRMLLKFVWGAKSPVKNLSLNIYSIPHVNLRELFTLIGPGNYSKLYAHLFGYQYPPQIA